MDNYLYGSTAQQIMWGLPAELYQNAINRAREALRPYHDSLLASYMPSKCKIPDQYLNQDEIDAIQSKCNYRKAMESILFDETVH